MTSLAEKICLEQGVNRFALAINRVPMLETARIGGDADPSKECSSIGRAPVSKFGNDHLPS